MAGGHPLIINLFASWLAHARCARTPARPLPSLPGTRHSAATGRRREPTTRHLARARRRIGHRWKNWRRAASRRPAAKAGTLAVEGLNVTGMTRSAKDTVEAPGTNVARKSGTSRVMLDTGPAAPERMQGSRRRTRSPFPPGTRHGHATRAGWSRPRNAGRLPAVATPAGPTWNGSSSEAAQWRTGDVRFRCSWLDPARRAASHPRCSWTAW